MELVTNSGMCRIRPTAPTVRVALRQQPLPGTLGAPTACGRASLGGAAASASSDYGHDVMVGARVDGDISGATDPKFWNRVGPPAGRSPV